MNQTVVLKHGLKIGKETHTSVTIREPLLADMIAAEEDAPAHKSIAYRTALLTQCITNVGSFDDVVTVEVLGRLHPSDFNILSLAMDAVSEEGKPAASDSTTS